MVHLYLLSVTIAAINIYSVKLADRVGVVFSSTKLIAMAIIVVGGGVRIAQGTLLLLCNQTLNVIF